MPLLLRILLLLLVLATLLSGVGYDPLAWLVPWIGAYALPSVLVCLVIFILARRSVQLENQVYAVTGRLEALRAQEQTAVSRSDVTRTEQLADEVHELRRMMAQNELVLPGRLLLQQYY